METSKRLGPLFYLVERSVDESEANMTLETVTWEYSARLQLPLEKKAKQAVEWKSPDLPNLPLLVNKKALKEHARLIVYQSIPRRQSGDSRTSKESGSKERTDTE